MELTYTEARILKMLDDGMSVADIKESLAPTDPRGRQGIFDELASLLERKLAEPSGCGIELSQLGRSVLQEYEEEKVSPHQRG